MARPTMNAMTKAMSLRTGVLRFQSYFFFNRVNSSSTTTVMEAIIAVASALSTNAFNKSVLRKCLNTGGLQAVVFDFANDMSFFKYIYKKY